jgi:hypothetical protein
VTDGPRWKDLYEARRLWYSGGAFAEVPDDPPRWDRLSPDKLRRWARQEYEKPNKGSRLVVGPRWLSDEDEVEAGAAVADFVLRFFVPLKRPDAAEPWLAFGELRLGADEELEIHVFGVGPYDDRLASRGLTYAVWRRLSVQTIRDAAQAELGRIAAWRRFQERTGLRDVMFDERAGEVAAEEFSPALPRSRGNPGRTPREHFEFATRWLIAQQERAEKGGVLEQLAQHYGQTKDGIAYRRARAERLGFLSRGQRYRAASRSIGPSFIAFWESLDKDDALKQHARALVPRARKEQL